MSNAHNIIANMNYLHQLVEILSSTFGITCLVMVMLLLIEFVNVSSSGKLLEKLGNKPYLQILISSLLGLIPGCIGGFTIVSLYTHRLLSFGALVAGMITTFGDSAFILFAISPRTAPLLFGSLLVVGLIAGVFTHWIFRNKSFYTEDTHTLKLHEEHTHKHGHIQLAFSNIKNISFPRAVLLCGLLVYLTAIFTGAITHEHGSMPDLTHAVAPTMDEHNHADCEFHSETTAHHHHEEASHMHGENIIFAIIAIITLIIVSFAPEHFLQEHLWEHVIKKHFISVLLWTFGVLLFLKLLYVFVDVNVFIQQHEWMTLLLLFLAIGLGIIPESQPQFIWIYLYFSGVAPFSILLASSIVQDGHGALPLLAYSRQNFLLMKALNVTFGLIVGLAGYFIGF